jgi:hypothetical protein
MTGGSAAQAMVPPDYVQSWGSAGGHNREFERLWGIAVDNGGNV